MGHVIYFFVQLRLSAFTLIMVLFSASAYSEEDPYLKALEAEAEIDTPVSGGGSSADSMKSKSIDPQKAEKKNFENKLLNELPTTYKTYKMLSTEDKLKVFNVYIKNNKDMEKASRHLYELYYK